MRPSVLLLLLAANGCLPLHVPPATLPDDLDDRWFVEAHDDGRAWRADRSLERGTDELACEDCASPAVHVSEALAPRVLTNCERRKGLQILLQCRTHVVGWVPSDALVARLVAISGASATPTQVDLTLRAPRWIERDAEPIMQLTPRIDGAPIYNGRVLVTGLRPNGDPALLGHGRALIASAVAASPPERAATDLEEVIAANVLSTPRCKGAAIAVREQVDLWVDPGDGALRRWTRVLVDTEECDGAEQAWRWFDPETGEVGK